MVHESHNLLLAMNPTEAQAGGPPFDDFVKALKEAVANCTYAKPGQVRFFLLSASRATLVINLLGRPEASSVLEQICLDS